MDELKEKILQEIRAREDAMKLQDGDILIEDVMQAAGVSDKTAIRIMQEKVKEKRVQVVKVRGENGYLKTAYRPIKENGYDHV